MSSCIISAYVSYTIKKLLACLLYFKPFLAPLILALLNCPNNNYYYYCLYYRRIQTATKDKKLTRRRAVYTLYTQITGNGTQAKYN